MSTTAARLLLSRKAGALVTATSRYVLQLILFFKELNDHEGNDIYLRSVALRLYYFWELLKCVIIF